MVLPVFQPRNRPFDGGMQRSKDHRKIPRIITFPGDSDKESGIEDKPLKCCNHSKNDSQNTLAELFGRRLRSVQKIARPLCRRTLRNRLFQLVSGPFDILSGAADFGPGGIDSPTHTRHDLFIKDLPRLGLHTRVGSSAFCRHPQCTPKKRHIGFLS